MKSIAEKLAEAYVERQQESVLEKISEVDGQPVTLYSKDGEHWATSVAEIDKWEKARERRQQKIWGDHRAAFNPAVSGRRRKQGE